MCGDPNKAYDCLDEPCPTCKRDRGHCECVEPGGIILDYKKMWEILKADLEWECKGRGTNPRSVFTSGALQAMRDIEAEAMQGIYSKRGK